MSYRSAAAPVVATALTVQSGVTSGMTLLVVAAGSSDAGYTANTVACTCSNGGATVTQLVAGFAANNLYAKAWKVTGAVAGDTFTFTAGADRLQAAWAFDGDLTAGTVATRGGVSQTTIGAPTYTVPTGGAPFVLFIERTLATTGAPSYSNASSYTVTQDNYFELTSATDPATSLALAHLNTPAGSATGITTATYSGASGNAAAFHLAELGTSTAASGTAALTLTGSGTARATTASSTAALSLTGAATARATTASSTASLSLTGGATAAATAPAGMASLTLTGTGVAGDVRPATGTASLTLTGTATAATTAVGTGSLTLTGAATPTAAAAGTGALTLTGTGGGGGQLAASGTATLALTATNTATGTRATGTASLTLTGAAAAPTVATTSVGTLDLTATLTEVTATGVGTASLDLTATIAATTGEAAGVATLELLGIGTATSADSYRDITVTARLVGSTYRAALIPSAYTARIGETVIVGSTIYQHVALTADHDISGDTVRISLNGGTDWYNLEHVAGTTDSTWRILLGAGQTLNPTGDATALVQINDSPEVVIVNAGRFYVTTA